MPFGLPKTTMPTQFAKPAILKDALALFLITLSIRGLTALPQQQPNYMDDAYYYVNAINLAQGRGFVEDFVWNYLDQPDRPPQPSHLYWMPLTSILSASSMIIFGHRYRAAQFPLIGLAALLAPMAYFVALTLSNRRRLGWLAGWLMIFSGFYLPYWTTTDNFTPFAMFGAAALFFVGYSLNNAVGTKQPLFWPMLLAGLSAGLAHLTRADGGLILLSIALFITVRHRRSAGRILLILMLGYILIMAPWFVRNWQVIGRPLSTTGTQTIWLTHYDDLFSYGKTLSPNLFFAQGTEVIIDQKLWALSTNFQRVLAEWFMIFLLPLALIGVWKLRHHPLMQLSGLYAMLLFIAMTFIFTFPGVRGGLFHSAGALLPFIYGASVVGFETLIDWLAARRRGWNAALAKQVFGVGLISLAAIVSSFAYFQKIQTWNNSHPTYPLIVEWLGLQGGQAMVMVSNPPMYRQYDGGLSLVIPNEDIETTFQVMQTYQATYLILEADHPAPLNRLYEQPDHTPYFTLVEVFGDDGGTYLFEMVTP